MISLISNIFIKGKNNVKFIKLYILMIYHLLDNLDYFLILKI